MIRFGSFWSGFLSPYEATCLSSFASKGHDVVLYSYQKMQNLPSGIQQMDAGEIVDRSYLHRFITGGKSNLAHFSDYFRYLMFLKTDLWWIDADLFLLGSLDVDRAESFLVRENRSNICNAFLRINSTASELKEIIQKTEAIIDRDVPWATTQNVIAKTFKKNCRQLAASMKGPKEFMPVHYDEYYKLLLPEFAEECAEKCRNAKTVHLYNNILDRIGVCKILLPPEGSYLHYLFSAQKQVDGFRGAYPVSVMRTLIANRRMMFTGECLSPRALAKQAIPSLARTVHKIKWGCCHFLQDLAA